MGTGQRALYLRNLMNHDAHRMVSDLHFVSESCLGAPPPKVEDDLRDATLAANDMSIDELAHTLMIDEVVIAVDERRGISLERLLTCKTSGIPVTGFQTFVEREKMANCELVLPASYFDGENFPPMARASNELGPCWAIMVR